LSTLSAIHGKRKLSVRDLSCSQVTAVKYFISLKNGDTLTDTEVLIAHVEARPVLWGKFLDI
jgi:hypothetical protein